MQKFSQKQILFALIALVVLLVFAASLAVEPTPVTTIINQNTPTTTAPTPKTNTNSKKANTNAQVTQTQQQSYVKYTEEYKGRLITFNKCASLFATYTFKSGTTIMLDGQYDYPQTITLGGKSYALKAHGYAFAKLDTVKAPKTFNLSCTTQGQSYYNIAKITLQP